MKPDKAQTLIRAVNILECFSPEQPELGVREVSRIVGHSSSATGRLMLAMKELGILNQNPATKTYSIGARSLAWAGIYLSTCDIRVVAMPYMEELHQSTRETISLYILDGDERVCVERLESPQNVRIVARIGRRLPLYAGSAGKAFLAFLPDGRREEIINSLDLKPYTPDTIVNKEVLRGQLEGIRQSGFAVSHGEWTPEATGLAAPIFGQRNELTAVVTISGPSQRFNDGVVQEYSVLITKAAQKISFSMGSRNRSN
jgi:IclR family transcriptional regulator, KDG regulon repressor